MKTKYLENLPQVSASLGYLSDSIWMQPWSVDCSIAGEE